MKPVQYLPDSHPFVFPNEGPVAVVCVHGFEATPYEVRPVGRALADRGFHVVGPAVAGHAIAPRREGIFAFRQATRGEWLSSVRSVVTDLRTRFDRVYLYGQSMGGIIVLNLAAEGLAEAVAVTGAALILPWPARFLAPFLKRLDVVVPVPWSEVPENPRYRAWPSKAIHELYLLSRETVESLSRVTCPVVACHSKRDSTITPKVVALMEQELSGPFEVNWFHKTGHTMTLHVEADAVVSRIVEFFLSLENGHRGDASRRS